MNTGELHVSHVSGKVVKGLGLAGEVFGVPTANLWIEGKLTLELGVYAGQVKLGETTYGAVICYGADGAEKFEVHLLDFSGDLYGTQISVELLGRISGLVPWESKEQMRKKIHEDVTLTRDFFARYCSTL